MCETSATASATSSAALLEQDKTQHGALGGLESSRQHQASACPWAESHLPRLPARAREREEQAKICRHVHTLCRLFCSKVQIQ